MDSLRILVADDHEIVRRGVVSLLKSQAGWEVCGEARDGREAVDKANLLRPDIVILDIGMPNLNGLEAARQMLHHDPMCKILVLTIEDGDELVRAVLDAGARGFVHKSDASRDLVAAVRALQSNKIFFTSRMAEVLLNGFLGCGRPVSEGKVSSADLSGREREIVQLLAEGKSSKQIASHLALSVKTVDTHRGNIMRKLHLHSLSALVLFAVRNRMVQVAIFPADVPPGTQHHFVR
jgi:DNA-binding NarL/FixJ family response regulator